MTAGGDSGTDDTLAPADATGTVATVAPVDSNAPTLAPVDSGGATLAAPASGTGRTQPDALAFALPPLASDLYELRQEIGRGGMGRVVAARDRRLDRPVALKLLQVHSADVAERFRREAQITARLQHPGIVPLYEAGRLDSGEPFYAMKHVAGRPLDHVIAQADTTRARLEILPSILAVADALAYAHDRRIIHRDLKPGNVILGEFGETVVIDWGLAKDLDDTASPADAGPYRATAGGDGSLTMVGAVMGTPAYMPPEQARGEPVDERADVYAIGAILYQALTGETVHPGTTIEAVLAHAIAATPIAPIARLAPDIPTDLAAIAMKALAADAADRYASAKDLAIDLRRFQAGQLVGVHRYTARALAWRWVKRHRGAVAVAAGAIAVVATLSALGLSRIEDERAEAVHQRTLAEDAKAKAETEGDEAVLAQAASLAATDPAASIAWLKRLSPATPRWSAARTIAADAAHHHVPDLLPAPDFLVDDLVGTRSGKVVFARSHLFSRLVIYDLPTGRMHVVDLGSGMPFGPSSADDRTVAVATAAGIALVPIAGGPTQIVPGTTKETYPRAFSRDGAWLAVTAATGSRVIPVGGGAARALLPAREAQAVAFTADGASIVEVGKKWVRVFSLADAAAPARELAIAGDTAVVSDDGARVASITMDSGLEILAVATGERTTTDYVGNVRVISAAGPWIAIEADQQVLQAWDGPTRIEQAATHFAHAGDVSIWATEDRLWIEDPVTGKHQLEVPGAVSALWLSPDARDVVVAAGDGTIRRWRVADLTGGFEQPVCGNVARLPEDEPSPDGHWFVQVGKLGEASLDICDPRTDTLRTVWAPDGAPAIRSFTWSADGQRVATHGARGSGFVLWDLRAGTAKLGAAPLDPLAIANDGSRVIGARGPTLVALDVATGTSATICAGLDVRRVSPDLKQAFGTTDKMFGGCDLATGAVWTSGALRDTFDQAIAPDGSTAVVTGETGATLWNLATHQATELALGTREWPRSIGYAHDGARLMIATPTFATIFDRAGAVVQRVRLPPGYLQGVWFSPDGTRVVVADQTNGATIYDLATGQRRSVRLPTETSVLAWYLDGAGAVISIGGSDNPTISRWADDLPLDPAGVRAWIAASTSAVLDPFGRVVAGPR